MPAPSRGQPRADPRLGPGYGEERGPRALSLGPRAVCESRKAKVRATLVQGALPCRLRGLGHRSSGVMRRRPRLRPPCRVRGTRRWRSRAGRGMRCLVGNEPGSKVVLPASHSKPGSSLQPFNRAGGRNAPWSGGLPTKGQRWHHRFPAPSRGSVRTPGSPFTSSRRSAWPPGKVTDPQPEGMVERTGLTACPVGSKRP